MGANELLRLVVDADVQGAVSGLKKVGDTTTKELGKSQKTIDKWGKGFSKAGVGLMAAGGGLLAGLGAMAKRSEEANLSTVKLQNSLSANPRLAGTSAKSFIDLAQAIQGKTAADGDDIVAGMAVLAQGKLQARQIKELTPLVVDLARKKGLDEVQAFTLASKAVQGNAGALKRAGIQVDETKFKTDAFGATVDALKGSVGGFAQAEGKTFQGSLQRAKNQLGDLEESVGAGAVDAFTSLFSVVGKTANAFESISPGAQAAAGKLGVFAGVGLLAAGGISTLIGQLIKMRSNFSDAAKAISGIKDSLGGLGGAAAFTGFTVGATILVTELERLGDEADKRTIDKVTAQLNNLGSTFDTGLADKITKWAKAARESDTDFVFKNFSKVLDNSVPAARRFIDVVDGLDASTKKLIGAKTIERMKQAVEDKSKADVAGAAAQSQYSDEVQKGAAALDDQTSSAQKAADALQAYHDKISELFDPIKAYRDAVKENQAAQGDYNAKVMEAVAAQAALTDAVKRHGPHSKQAAEASLNYAAAVSAQRDAQDKTIDSALGLDGAMADLRAEIQRNPKAADEAKAKLNQLAGAHIITGAQASAAARQIDGFVASVNRTPAHKNTAFTTSGIAAAQRAIHSVNDAIANTPGYKSVTIDLHVTGAAAVARAEAKLLGPGHAGGGPVKAGMVYPVGEHGPELFAPTMNGTIIPAGRFNTGGGGMAMGGDTNVVINVMGGDPQAVVTALKRYMRHNGPVPIAVTGRNV